LATETDGFELPEAIISAGSLLFESLLFFHAVLCFGFSQAVQKSAQNRTPVIRWGVGMAIQCSGADTAVSSDSSAIKDLQAEHKCCDLPLVGPGTHRIWHFDVDMPSTVELPFSQLLPLLFFLFNIVSGVRPTPSSLSCASRSTCRNYPRATACCWLCCWQRRGQQRVLRSRLPSCSIPRHGRRGSQSDPTDSPLQQICDPRTNFTLACMAEQMNVDAETCVGGEVHDTSTTRAVVTGVAVE
jgi:hypothetical protein